MLQSNLLIDSANTNLFNYSREEKKELNSAAAMSAFEKVSKERKQSVKDGETPDFYITQGYMLYQRNYAYNGETIREAFKRIAEIGRHYKPNPELAKKKFFDLMWKGFLAPSTPVYLNTNNNRGDSVSCSGGYISDSVSGFYTGLREGAMLSKRGYGTSGYLGDIRPRGTPISKGGTADGALPVFKLFHEMARHVSQANARRGVWAGYIGVMHGDFDEIWDYCFKHPSETNVGWLFHQKDIDALNANDPEMVRRWNMVMFLRARYGKGYIVKPDTMNEFTSEAIKKSGIPIKASNLCSEIALPHNEEYSFSCVLSSLNLSKWFEFDEDTIFWSTIFLDCVVEQTLEETEGVHEIEPLWKFTRDFRALGLGALGWHTLLQQLSLPFDSLKAKLLNKQIFSKMYSESMKASQHLASVHGAPKFCKDFGYANATLLAIAPNTSSALLAGGVSQGIEPLVSNTYNQNTAGGEVARMNPTLIKLLQERGKYSDELVADLQIARQGSVAHLDFLSDHEKRVFAPAFEINQDKLVDQASDRQPYICQAQSLNLFSSGDEHELARVSKRALNMKNVKSLYYLRAIRSVRGSSGEAMSFEGACKNCEA